MAAKTRLGLSAFTRKPYGSFAGKTENVDTLHKANRRRHFLKNCGRMMG